MKNCNLIGPNLNSEMAPRTCACTTSKFMVLLSSTMTISLPLNPAVVNLRPRPQPSPAALLSGTPFPAKIHLLRFCSAPTSGNVTRPGSSGFDASSVEKQGIYSDSSGFDASSVEKQGSNGKDDSSQPVSSNETLARLKRYGISGILSYGLLNTAYYLSTFLVVWFYVAPAPTKMGYLAAAQRFLKVMAMVWAGSQVTKLMRAGGALALAPFVDRGLSWFTIKFGFKSQGKAVAVIAGICFGLAFLMFAIVTLLWA